MKKKETTIQDIFPGIENITFSNPLFEDLAVLLHQKEKKTKYEQFIIESHALYREKGYDTSEIFVEISVNKHNNQTYFVPYEEKHWQPALGISVRVFTRHSSLSDSWYQEVTFNSEQTKEVNLFNEKIHELIQGIIEADRVQTTLTKAKPKDNGQKYEDALRGKA